MGKREKHYKRLRPFGKHNAPCITGRLKSEEGEIKMEQLTELLRELAKQLGTTSDHILAVMMKQSRIAIAQNFIWLGVLIVYVTQSVRIHNILGRKKKERQETKSYYDGNLWGIPMCIHWCVVAIMTICVVAIACDLVTLLFNPEYWVVNKILSTIGDLAH